jgi:hypothetical protein
MKAALIAALAAACVSPSVAFGRAPLAAQRLTGDPKMDSRLRASRAEHEHQQFIDDANELVRISGELSKDLETRNSLVPEDGKKLDRIRKLAKHLRSELGAMGDPDLQNPPATLHAAAEALGERSKELASHVEKSNRFEVNTRMVTTANALWVLSDIISRLGGRR